MKSTCRVLFVILAVTAGAFLGAATPGAAQVSPPAADSLYVGDAFDNTIKRFDAQTGDFLGVLVPTSAGLLGPRGILHVGGTLLVSNQNAGQPFAGEVDRFDILTGRALNGPVVPHTSVHAPFAPRGIVVGPGGTLYVADLGRGSIGRIETYDVSTGKLKGNLNFDQFTNSAVSNGEFHLRGLVFGPDGGLYISLFSEKNFPLFGWVLRYDLGTGSVRVMANNGPTAGATDDCTPHLNAPEGLAFGPDGRLYVATLRATPQDVDRVLVLSSDAGRCVDTIELYGHGELRVRAHALVFGPGGSLLVPLDASAPDGSLTQAQREGSGAIRRYDVTTKTFSNLVNAGGSLLTPWYLTFGNTSPTTLAYTD